MSSDGGPVLGSGGFFGGGGGGGTYGPNGPYGPWPGCGCGSLLIIIGGLLLACGGFIQMFSGQFGRF
jgi:hypothetical protein